MKLSTTAKKLGGSLRQYKKATMRAPILVMLETIMEVAIPTVTAILIDDGVDTGNMGTILRIGLILIVMALLGLAFGAQASALSARAAVGLAANLRKDMYHNIQSFSFSNIDKFSTASLVTRQTTDVTNVQMAFMMCLRIAVKSPFMTLFAMIMAFRISWEIALVFVGATPVLCAGLYLLLSRAHPIFERVFKTYDKLNNVVQENLRGIRVVKAFVREEHERKKFSDVSREIFLDFSKAEKLLALNMPVMQFCIYACMLLASWLGARLIVSGVMTTGELMSIMMYAMQILISLMMLSMVFIMITISRASAERIAEVLEEKSDLGNGEHPVYEVKDGSIRFQEVDFSYAGDPGRLCLSGVNLNIGSGQTVGILGGTGSSKSTLVQLIARLYDVTGGAVQVGGVDVRKYDLETLRSEVAIVLQKNMLFSGTIRENLRWGDPNASDAELERVCKLAQADSFIREFPDGYDTHIEQGGTNVSGGQKQRLCIARALLKKPKVLILDDSTSAVDTQTDAQIRRAFREEIPDTTKLIIAQRVASVEDADQIIILEGGRVADVGTHAGLMERSEIYREVYFSQKKGGQIDEPAAE